MVYRLGDWLKNIQDGDLWEIIKLTRIQGDNYVQIAKKVDYRSNAPYRNIFHCTMSFNELQNKYEPAPMARVLYGSDSIKRGSK